MNHTQQLYFLIDVFDDILPVRKYFPWRGQLQIGTKFYDVALKSSAGAMIPAQL